MKIMRVLTRPNLGGPTKQAVALWHAHRDQGLRSLLVVGACSRGEDAIDLAATGIPQVAPEQILAGEAVEGFARIDALGRSLRPLRDMAAMRVLRRWIRGWQPDVLHTHTSKAGWVGRAAAHKERVPVIAHTFHGLVLRDYYPAPVGEAFRRLEMRAARRANLLFAVSPSCRAELAELGVAPANKIDVIPPAVPLEKTDTDKRDDLRLKLGIARDTLVIGFIGRFTGVKRPEIFIEALRHSTDARGLMLGDGPSRRKLQASAPLNISMLGARSEASQWLSAMDVLMLPSLREGCPLVAIEAFAAGIPVVGFDVPGVRDIAGDWGAAVTIPESEGAIGLARAIKNLHGDRNAYASVVDRSRSGLARFTPARVAAQLAARYRDVLEARIGSKMPHAELYSSYRLDES